jgi:hypothetical protein
MGLIPATNPLPFAGGAVVMLLFSLRPRQARFRSPFLPERRFADGFPPAQKEVWVMQQVATLLRRAPTRIGQRLAQLIAIAAASLPDVGA